MPIFPIRCLQTVFADHLHPLHGGRLKLKRERFTQASRRGQRLLVLTFISSLSVLLAGCSLPPADTRAAQQWITTVDEDMRPQLDRFRSALGKRMAQPVDANSEEMQHFTAAFGATVRYHVDPVDSAALIDAAIAGLSATSNEADLDGGIPPVDCAIAEMLSSLGKGNAYISPEIYRDLQMDRRGRFGGVGLELTIRKGVVTIVSPIEDTPAYRAGVLPGDRLVAIDGVPTGGHLARAVQRLRGPVGSQVDLTILHSDGAQQTLRLTREIVRLQGVTYSRVRGTYGYIRISQFHERTSRDLEDALVALQQGGELQGVVLDLRKNPGGLLAQTVAVADVFLDAGLIVSTKSRIASENRDYYANGGSDWAHIPMAALVDGGSAAGSEILAAALQAHRRAQILGSPTFGTGTIQTIIPVGGDAAIRLTTSRAYSPLGSPIEDGVVPDVVLNSRDPLGARSADDEQVAMAIDLLSTNRP